MCAHTPSDTPPSFARSSSSSPVYYLCYLHFLFIYISDFLSFPSMPAAVAFLCWLPLPSSPAKASCSAAACLPLVLLYLYPGVAFVPCQIVSWDFLSLQRSCIFPSCFWALLHLDSSVLPSPFLHFCCFWLITLLLDYCLLRELAWSPLSLCPNFFFASPLFDKYLD